MDEFDMPIGIATQDVKKGDIVLISMIKQNGMFVVEDEDERA